MNVNRRRRRTQIRFLEDRPQPTLQATAGSRRALLQAVGTGLATLQTASGEAAPEDSAADTRMFPVELQRVDFDAILTAWIEELLQLSARHGTIFDSFEILQLDLEAECRLTATVEGNRTLPATTAGSVQLAEPSPRVRQTREGFECEVRFRRRDSASMA